MTTSAIPDPRTAGAELEQNTGAIARQMRAADVAIRDTAGLAQAVLDRQALGEAMKRVETYFAPLKKGAHDLHKLLCNRETDLLAPLREVDAAKRDAMTTYHEQEQRAREARERDLADARQRDEQTRAAVEARRPRRRGRPCDGRGGPPRSDRGAAAGRGAAGSDARDRRSEISAVVEVAL